MIVAVAGRRIDAPNAQPPRFPLARREPTYRRILAQLRAMGATAVVCSAACGADLLALKAARELEIRRHIILPYHEDWFLEDSVTDRPGEWESLYRSLLADAHAANDLVTLDFPRGSDDAFRAANETILSEAQRLADEESPTNPAAALGGLIVWEGAPRGPDDITAHLRDRLLAAHARVEQAITLATAAR
ncbi:MAG: hypothetical protein KGO05_09125 [Chloroflexota bacterium]|nr:hypothetical protein [Chloroflexota bacterium]